MSLLIHFLTTNSILGRVKLYLSRNFYASTFWDVKLPTIISNRRLENKSMNGIMNGKEWRKKDHVIRIEPHRSGNSNINIY